MTNDSTELEELFQLNKEEPVNEPSKTTKTKRTTKTEEVDVESNQGEPQTESTDTTDSTDRLADPGPKRTSRGSKNVSAKSRPIQGDGTGIGNHGGDLGDGVIQGQWHTNIIGKPKGHPNPWFQGIATDDGLKHNQVLVPFNTVTHAQRQVYVDDINLENPTVLGAVYRVQGDFVNVLVRITEDMFNEVLVHPELSKVKVTYSWVSDHCSPRRNYIVKHDERPTKEELASRNKHMDEVEWSFLPAHKKEELKSKDAKYQDMPKDEIVPPPADLMETEIESGSEQLEE